MFPKKLQDSFNKTLEMEHQYLTYFIVIGLACLHFAYLASFSLNVPNGDDLYCIYDAVLQFDAAKGFWQKITVIITPWLEHTIAYTKLLAIANYKILGKLDFKVYIITGNLSLVGIAFIFYKVLKGLEVNVWYFIPIALLLFQPQSYEGQYWPAATAAYMSVIFYSMLCFYILFLTDDRWLFAALLAGIMALYTFGAGIITLIVALGVLVLKRDFKKAVIWSIGCLLVYGIFITFYTYPAAERPPIFEALLNTPSFVLNYFLSFLGMILDFEETPKMPSQVIAIILFGGVLSLLLLLFLAISWIRTFNRPILTSNRPMWFLISLSLFVVGSTLSMALLRGQTEMIYLFSSRYKIYPIIFLITTYLTALYFFKRNLRIKQSIAGIITTFAILFFIVSYYSYTYKIIELRNYFLSGMYNWNNNKQWLIYRETSYFEPAANSIGLKMDQKESPYHVPKVLEGLTHKNIKLSPATSALELTIGNPNRFNAVLPDIQTESLNQGHFLFIHSSSKIYVFPVTSNKNAKLDLISTTNWFKSGGYCSVSTLQLEPAKYQIGEYNSANNEIKLSNQLIEINEDYSISKL